MSATQTLSSPFGLKDMFNTIVLKPLWMLATALAFCVVTHALTTAAFMLPMHDIGQALLHWDFSSLMPVPTDVIPAGCHVHANGVMHCLSDPVAPVDPGSVMDMM